MPIDKDNVLTEEILGSKLEIFWDDGCHRGLPVSGTGWFKNELVWFCSNLNVNPKDSRFYLWVIEEEDEMKALIDRHQEWVDKVGSTRSYGMTEPDYFTNDRFDSGHPTLSISQPPVPTLITGRSIGWISFSSIMNPYKSL